MIAALALLAGAAASPLASPQQTPIELFKATCMGGSVSLAKGSVAPIAFAAAPEEARAALGATQLSVAEPALTGSPAASDVPGQVFEVGPGRKILLLAPAAAGRAGRFARSCAVVWKGEQFAAAREAIMPAPTKIPTPGSGAKVPAEAGPEANSLGIAAFAITWGGLHLSASTLGGWTVLKADPEAEPAKSGER